MRKVTVEYPPGSGARLEGNIVDVTSAKEPWAEYELEDGTALRVRTTLVEITRIDGQHDPDGNPIYQFKASASLTVNAPDTLRKK